MKNLFQQEVHLEAILRQQAQQLAGRPGWPSTPDAVYQYLLDQIEADLLASSSPR